MNKNMSFFALIILNVFVGHTHLSAMISASSEDQVIPNSSYCIYEGADPSSIIGGVAPQSKFVTFYTFDGEQIARIEHHFHFKSIEKKLDPSAPKPQPTSCEVKYWPAISVGFFRKGTPGWFVVFYDKKGNQIKSYRYNVENGEATVFLNDGGSKKYNFDASRPQSSAKNFPLDLSIISNVKIIR